jgi:hypothetical protein
MFHSTLDILARFWLGMAVLRPEFNGQRSSALWMEKTDSRVAHACGPYRK